MQFWSERKKNLIYIHIVYETLGKFVLPFLPAKLTPSTCVSPNPGLLATFPNHSCTACKKTLLKIAEIMLGWKSATFKDVKSGTFGENSV